MTPAGPAEHLEAAAALRARLGVAVTSPQGGCGIPSIDEEHAICAAARNAALEALERNDPAALALALSRYRALTEAHFRSEEDLMLACAFPQATPHAAAHAQYLAFVDRCAAELGRAGVTSTVRTWIGEGIPQWFSVHLANDDAIARHVARTRAVVERDVPWRAGVPECGGQPAEEEIPATPAAADGRLGPAKAHAAALSRALEGGDLDEARRVLGALGAGLRTLFTAEERLMAESAYVGAAHHALAHDLILADLALLGRAIDKGSAEARARWTRLRSAMWLEAHRTHADAALEAHLAARDEQGAPSDGR
ncbi:MAG: hemerythrin domain-containing protein [Anaeromyxobacteraceae bacterium]